jgi:hypothetical protein
MHGDGGRQTDLARHPDRVQRRVLADVGSTTRRAGDRAVRKHLAATVGLFLVALVVLGFEAGGTTFEADEADYTATSRYFGYLFLQGDVSRKEWGSNHWTRTQPPLTRYIVGAWLTGYGYDLEKMNQPYVSTASSFEVNRQKGRVPTDDVLSRARQPMVILGAVAIALLYPLGLLLGGTIAGVGAVGLALSSAFLRYTLVHAWAEAPLACFMLLAAWLAAIGLRRVLDGNGWVGWGLALGVALGLASTTKLTGLVGIAIVVAVAGALAVVRGRRQEPATARRVVGWAATATGVALVVFVGLNPYLWRDPVGGVIGMLEERRDEMAFQQEQWPEFAVLNVADRPWLLAVGATRIGPWSDWPAVAVPIGLGLAALGLAALWSRLRAGRADPAVLMLLGWLGGYTAAIFAGLGLSYPRYFLPACLLLLPLIGAGLALIVTRAAATGRSSEASRLSPAASSARSR